jgi:uncharacterized protein
MSLPFTLEPDGSPACDVRESDGAIVATAAAKTDMFVDPGAAPGASVPDAGRLLGTPPPGDFRFSARVSVDFRSVFDAGVLLVYAGDRRWAKLCYEYAPQQAPTAVSVVTRGYSDDCNSFETDGSPLWLRITRSGPAWAFHASRDGAYWRMLRYFSLGDAAAGASPVTPPDTHAVRIGLMPQSPAGDGCTVSFDEIAFVPGAPANLRDGT